jgi:uncharacterized protein HemY
VQEKILKGSEAVKEFEKAEAEDADGPRDLWIYLGELFDVEKDWDELQEMLTKQLEKKKKK